MCNLKLLCALFLFFTLCSCSYYSPNNNLQTSSNKIPAQVKNSAPANYASRIPQHLDTNGKKLVLVDPNVHVWGAYGVDGNLVRAGLATAGSNWCPDLGRSCHTKAGTFHINSLGRASFKSSIFPMPRGGAPMPYCMFFNRNQGLHGSYNVAEANLSHGCVRMRVPDAEWLRFNFVNVGTTVVVKPY